ncbi:MAG: cell division protein ZapB [Acidobacteriaceae bacterium]|nr:cell division protein ZapB [Acidobacteriaceae bacterium]MBV9780103.1 cell division protein ZapB [Acidobacteriaceae bacterium]
METAVVQAESAESIDTLANLEQRITRAVELITTLRAENDQLRERLKGAQSELEELRTERKHVKARIEKLLGQMDLVSAS